jgi:5-methylcytosine-specific restriction endonuclease McrA
VGSGGAQFLEANSQWKDGRVAYRRLARMAGCACVLCGHVDVPKNMCAHHINHDRSDNRLENLRLVCKRCHQTVEHPRSPKQKGRWVAEVKSQKISGTPSDGQSDLKATPNEVARGND